MLIDHLQQACKSLLKYPAHLQHLGCMQLAAVRGGLLLLRNGTLFLVQIPREGFNFPCNFLRHSRVPGHLVLSRLGICCPRLLKLTLPPLQEDDLVAAECPLLHPESCEQLLRQVCPRVHQARRVLAVPMRSDLLRERPDAPHHLFLHGRAASQQTRDLLLMVMKLLQRLAEEALHPDLEQVLRRRVCAALGVVHNVHQDLSQRVAT
mmetsp:Transcript_31781/g.69482  ORF Transcript_31781/g.69482 Transcript_31781/m.69482 type:complete len:207 (-) Transcript_31781:360-980(-)